MPLTADAEVKARRAVTDQFGEPASTDLFCQCSARCTRASHISSNVSGIKQAVIGGSWAARYKGQSGAFPHDVDVIVVGTPNRDDVTEAVIEALRAVGLDGQVIFRSVSAWRDASSTN